MKYDYGKKDYDFQLGLQVKEDDHTWKFRLHNSGLARAALQWNMHKTVKTTVNTNLKVQDLLKGSVTQLPVGVQFDLKF